MDRIGPALEFLVLGTQELVGRVYCFEHVPTLRILVRVVSATNPLNLGFFKALAIHKN